MVIIYVMCMLELIGESWMYKVTLDQRIKKKKKHEIQVFKLQMAWIVFLSKKSNLFNTSNREKNFVSPPPPPKQNMPLQLKRVIFHIYCITQAMEGKYFVFPPPPPPITKKLPMYLIWAKFG